MHTLCSWFQIVGKVQWKLITHIRLSGIHHLLFDFVISLRPWQYTGCGWNAYMLYRKTSVSMD